MLLDEVDDLEVLVVVLKMEELLDEVEVLLDVVEVSLDEIVEEASWLVVVDVSSSGSAGGVVVRTSGSSYSGGIGGLGWTISGQTGGGIAPPIGKTRRGMAT